MLKVAIAILTIIGLLSFSLTAEEIENMVRGGDFEGGLMDWSLNQNIRGSVAAMEIDKKGSAEGKRSVHIKIDVAGADFHTVRIEQQSHSVEKNQEYTMSAWLKAEQGRNARLYVFDVAGGEPWFTFMNKEVFIDTEWKEYFGTFDAAQDSPNVSISVRVGESDVDVWVDDIRFYEGEYVPSEPEEQKAVSPAGDKLTITWGSIRAGY